MKKNIILGLSLILLITTACTPVTTPLPATPPATQPSTPLVPKPSNTIPPTLLPPSPSALPPTVESTLPALKQYTNPEFGISFQYPSNWFGPDEYVSGQTLRVAVGSDIVYPYGEPPEEPSTVKNSYNVVVQYSKNDQGTYWQDTYQSLMNLKDGESVSGLRSKLIRIRQLELGSLTGFEYISTLSETAQTEPVYSREVILIDNLSDVFSVLTVSGSPNNVEISEGSNWRDTYKAIDEANQDIFNQIVDSITVER